MHRASLSRGAVRGEFLVGLPREAYMIDCSIPKGQPNTKSGARHFGDIRYRFHQPGSRSIESAFGVFRSTEMLDDFGIGFGYCRICWIARNGNATSASRILVG